MERIETRRKGTSTLQKPKASGNSLLLTCDKEGLNVQGLMKSLRHPSTNLMEAMIASF